MSDAGHTEGAAQRATSIYALTLLTLIYALNYTDRNIFSIVLQSMKQELVLTDTQIGLIGGFAFVLFYSILGVPIARLADKHNRRLIIGAGFAFWSLMTAFTGLVSNVWQLAVCRFLMGAGEATGIAPSNSMVSDLFSKSRRPLALAVLASGSSIGYFFGYMLGGWVNQLYGWRAAFLVAGIPGIIIALIFVLTVREPARTGPAPKSWDKETFWHALRFLTGSRCYMFTVIGCSLLGINVYAILVWNAAFLIRVHGFTSAKPEPRWGWCAGPSASWRSRWVAISPTCWVPSISAGGCGSRRSAFCSRSRPTCCSCLRRRLRSRCSGSRSARSSPDCSLGRSTRCARMWRGRTCARCRLRCFSFASIWLVKSSGRWWSDR